MSKYHPSLGAKLKKENKLKVRYVTTFSFIFIFPLVPEEGLFSNRNIGQLVCIFLFYSFVYFLIALPLGSVYKCNVIVLIQVYNWEIRHYLLVCCCGLADILYTLCKTGNTQGM